MIELVVGFIAGVWGATVWFAADPQTAIIAGAFAAVVLYMISCYFFPYRKCWRCGGDKFREDGHDNLRPRNCWVCGKRRIKRRLGAYVMSRTRDPEL